eukprot:gene28250-35078_t
MGASVLAASTGASAPFLTPNPNIREHIRSINYQQTFNFIVHHCKKPTYLECPQVLSNAIAFSSGFIAPNFTLYYKLTMITQRLKDEGYTIESEFGLVNSRFFNYKRGGARSDVDVELLPCVDQSQKAQHPPPSSASSDIRSDTDTVQDNDNLHDDEDDFIDILDSLGVEFGVFETEAASQPTKPSNKSNKGGGFVLSRQPSVLVPRAIGSQLEKENIPATQRQTLKQIGVQKASVVKMTTLKSNKTIQPKVVGNKRKVLGNHTASNIMPSVATGVSSHVKLPSQSAVDNKPAMSKRHCSTSSESFTVFSDTNNHNTPRHLHTAAPPSTPPRSVALSIHSEIEMSPMTEAAFLACLDACAED